MTTDADRFEKIRDLNALEREGVTSLNTHEASILQQLQAHREKKDALMRTLAGEVAEGYAASEIVVRDGGIWVLKEEFRGDGTVPKDEAESPEPETGEETGEETTEAADGPPEPL